MITVANLALVRGPLELQLSYALQVEDAVVFSSRKSEKEQPHIVHVCIPDSADGSLCAVLEFDQGAWVLTALSSGCSVNKVFLSRDEQRRLQHDDVLATRGVRWRFTLLQPVTTTAKGFMQAAAVVEGEAVAEAIEGLQGLQTKAGTTTGRNFRRPVGAATRPSIGRAAKGRPEKISDVDAVPVGIAAPEVDRNEAVYSNDSDSESVEEMHPPSNREPVSGRFENAPGLEWLELAVGEVMTLENAGDVECFELSKELDVGTVDSALLRRMLKLRMAGSSFRFDQGNDLAKTSSDANDALQDFGREIEAQLLQQFCESSIRGSVPVPLVIRFTRGFRKGPGGEGFQHDFYCGHALNNEDGKSFACTARGVIVCTDFKHVRVVLSERFCQCVHVRGNQVGRIIGANRLKLIKNEPVRLSSMARHRAILAGSRLPENGNREGQQIPSSPGAVRKIVSEVNRRPEFKTNTIAELETAARLLEERNKGYIGDGFKLLKKTAPLSVVFVEKTSESFSLVFIHRPNSFVGPSVRELRPCTLWDASEVVRPYRNDRKILTFSALVPMGGRMCDFLLGELHTTSQSQANFKRFVEQVVLVYGGLTRLHLSDGAMLQVRTLLIVGNAKVFGVSDDLVVARYEEMVVDFEAALPEKLIGVFFCKSHFLRKATRVVLIDLKLSGTVAFCFTAWMSLLFEESDLRKFHNYCEMIELLLATESATPEANKAYKELMEAWSNKAREVEKEGCIMWEGTGSADENAVNPFCVDKMAEYFRKELQLRAYWGGPFRKRVRDAVLGFGSSVSVPETTCRIEAYFKFEKVTKDAVDLPLHEYLLDKGLDCQGRLKEMYHLKVKEQVDATLERAKLASLVHTKQSVGLYPRGASQLALLVVEPAKADEKADCFAKKTKGQSLNRVYGLGNLQHEGQKEPAPARVVQLPAGLAAVDLQSNYNGRKAPMYLEGVLNERGAGILEHSARIDSGEWLCEPAAAGISLGFPVSMAGSLCVMLLKFPGLQSLEKKEQLPSDFAGLTKRVRRQQLDVDTDRDPQIPILVDALDRKILLDQLPHFVESMLLDNTRMGIASVQVKERVHCIKCKTELSCSSKNANTILIVDGNALMVKQAVSRYCNACNTVMKCTEVRAVTVAPTTTHLVLVSPNGIARQYPPMIADFGLSFLINGSYQPLWYNGPPSRWSTIVNGCVLHSLDESTDASHARVAVYCKDVTDSDIGAALRGPQAVAQESVRLNAAENAVTQYLGEGGQRQNRKTIEKEVTSRYPNLKKKAVKDALTVIATYAPSTGTWTLKGNAKDTAVGNKQTVQGVKRAKNDEEVAGAVPEPPKTRTETALRVLTATFHKQLGHTYTDSPLCEWQANSCAIDCLIVLCRLYPGQLLSIALESGTIDGVAIARDIFRLLQCVDACVQKEDGAAKVLWESKDKFRNKYRTVVDETGSFVGLLRVVALLGFQPGLSSTSNDQYNFDMFLVPEFEKATGCGRSAAQIDRDFGLLQFPVLVVLKKACQTCGTVYEETTSRALFAIMSQRYEWKKDSNGQDLMVFMTPRKDLCSTCNHNVHLQYSFAAQSSLFLLASEYCYTDGSIDMLEYLDINMTDGTRALFQLQCAVLTNGAHYTTTWRYGCDMTMWLSEDGMSKKPPQLLQQSIDLSRVQLGLFVRVEEPELQRKRRAVEPQIVSRNVLDSGRAEPAVKAAAKRGRSEKDLDNNPSSGLKGDSGDHTGGTGSRTRSKTTHAQVPQEAIGVPHQHNTRAATRASSVAVVAPKVVAPPGAAPILAAPILAAPILAAPTVAAAAAVAHELTSGLAHSVAAQLALRPIVRGQPALRDYKAMCNNQIEGQLIFDPELRPETEVRIDDYPVVDVNKFLKTADVFDWVRLPKLVYRDHCPGVTRLDVVGDGNCYFRVLSVYKFSHENGWAFLRYMTMVHMIQNRELYNDWFGKGPITAAIHILSQVGVVIGERNVMDEYSNEIIMLAAATLLNRVIVVFPPMEGATNEINSHMTALTLIPLRQAESYQPPLVMEWSARCDHFRVLISTNNDMHVLGRRMQASEAQTCPPFFPPVHHIWGDRIFAVLGLSSVIVDRDAAYSCILTVMAIVADGASATDDALPPRLKEIIVSFPFKEAEREEIGRIHPQTQTAIADNKEPDN